MRAWAAGWTRLRMASCALWWVWYGWGRGSYGWMMTVTAYDAGPMRGTRLSLRLGAKIALGLPPGCWPEPVLRSVAYGRRAGQGDGEHPGGWPSRTLGGAGPPGCPTIRRREGETRKTGSGPEGWTGPGAPAGGPPRSAKPAGGGAGSRTRRVHAAGPQAASPAGRWPRREPGRMGGWPVPCRVTIVTLAARPMCWPRRPLCG